MVQDAGLTIRQDLLLRIMRVVAAVGVEFAIPSRSLYLTQDQSGLEQQQRSEVENALRMRNRR